MSKEDVIWAEFKRLMRDKKYVQSLERLLDKTWSHPGWNDMQKKRRKA